MERSDAIGVVVYDAEEINVNSVPAKTSVTPPKGPRPKPQTPKRCPLCGSADIRASKPGWSTIHCRNCHLSLARSIELGELIEIWNTRPTVPNSKVD